MFKPSERTVAVTTATFMIAGGGIAFAYWTQGGTGSGTAATGTTAEVTVNQTSIVTGLYPGGDAVTLSGDFDNPNTFPVTVDSLSAVVASTNKAGCAASNYDIGGLATIGGAIDPGTAKGSWTGLTIKMLETGANQDACKNAVVTITYTAAAAPTA